MDNQPNQSGTPTSGAGSRTPNSTSGSTPRAASANPTAAGTSGTSSTPGSASTADRSTQASSERQPSAEQPSQASGFLDTAMESGKKWIEDSHVLDRVNELPQSVKDWGSKAAARVGGLSTTQKVVGGALLAAGLGWLATRRRSESTDTSARTGRQSGGYVRTAGYGYQAPESSSRRPVGSSASSLPKFENSTNIGSDANDSRRSSRASYGSASSSDYGSRTSESSFGASPASGNSPRARNEDYRSIE
jgi:hypothetical protein